MDKECNDRFELYAVIANIISVNDIITSIYKSKNNKPRAADTNKSLMDYVLKFDQNEIGFQDAQKQELKEFVNDVLQIVNALQDMQKNEIKQYNVSIWFPLATNANTSKTKPSIRDFTSVAYYLTNHKGQDIIKIILDLKCIYKRMIEAHIRDVSNDQQNKDILDYYITFGKNQKQYAWKSISARYNIMIKYLSC